MRRRTSQTRDLLFDYFISKIFVGAASMTIVSWFFDGGPDIDFADLAKAKETEEVLNIKFDTSPSGVSALRAENNFLGLRRKNKFILRSTFVVVGLRGHVSNSVRWVIIC